MSRASSRENRKNQRITLDKPLRVVMCSIGGQVRYELATRNVSTTGFFLEFGSPARFPFNRSSIMEVWLEIRDNETIFFNGKMARVVHRGEVGDSDLGPGIGIRIVQIDKENEDKLRQFIQDNLAESDKKIDTVA